MTITPTPKVTAAIVGGAVATIVVWLLSRVGVDVPTAVDGAFATIAAAIAGWFTRDASSPNPAPNPSAPLTVPPSMSTTTSTTTSTPTPPTEPEAGAVSLQIVFVIAAVVVFVIAAILAFGSLGTHADLATAFGWGFVGLALFAAAHLPI